MMLYRVEREVEGVPLEDRCPGCNAPRVPTDEGALRIHRPHCHEADRLVGLQLALPGE
jgi:hypothetical protein